MKTLFLMGILVALVVIATKNEDQTAIEAALEMGHKAQNIVTKFDKTEAPITEPKYKVNPTSTPLKDDNPFIKRTKQALKSYKPKTAKLSDQASQIVTIKSASSTTHQKQENNNAQTVEDSAWSVAKPEKANYPEMPAMPKAVVEQARLGETVPIKLANAQAATVNDEKSYDLVKGYYENASRLLEEIK
jgi:hypothetical protein